MQLPWFMYSPSPISLIQYTILAWIFWGYLLKNVQYSRFSRLLACIDGFFIVAFFVVLTDGFWCTFCMIRWLPLFPGDAFQIFSSLGRDLAAGLLFGIMIWDHFKSRVLNFSFPVIFWLAVCALIQILWFFFSPSPAYTDHTFAWRHGYPLEVVLLTFFISHFLMRIPLWLALLNLKVELKK